MKRVLFVCIHNSARSQMAEAFLNRCGDGRVHAQSAGLEPGVLNPLVVRAMAELGIDLAGKSTQSVAQVLERGERFDVVVTVCDDASAERCPVVPGDGERLHWPFPDPSALSGPEEDRMREVRRIRDAIQRHVEDWCRASAG